MTSGGAEAFKVAIRRSTPLIIGLVLLGVAGVNAFQQLRGPEYDASARVLVSPTTLSSIVTETQPSFVDPERAQQTAVDIAAARQVYDLAADNSDQQFGTAKTLRSTTSVSAEESSDLISFTSSSSDPKTAVGRANSVAQGYIDYREQLSKSQIRDTILEATAAEQTSPAPLRDSLLGLAIGLIVALGIVAAREAIDTTVRSEGAVEDLLGAPVLASVRSLPRRTTMVTYGRHEPAFADAYALLAAQIERRGVAGRGEVIAVTSSVGREGKTTTAANLAVATARRGARVLLADFDFRKSRLGALFNLPADTPGALQVMSREAKLKEALHSVSLEEAFPAASRNSERPADGPKEDGEPGRGSPSLELLVSGGQARRPPHQTRLRSLLQQLRRRADLVIIDTPPALLTVELTELASLIDAVLVIVRHGHVSERSLSELRRQARGWSAELAGAVMTDARPTGRSSYYAAGR